MIAPTLTGTAGDARNVLSWKLVAGAVKTQLRRARGTGSFATVYQGKARSFTDSGLVNSTSYRYKARGVDAKGRFGPYSAEVVLMPCVADPIPGVVGYGTGTGGVSITPPPGGTLYTPSTYADFKTALLASGRRTIKPTGSTVFDAGNDVLSVTNGDLTVDGTNWTGSLKNYSLQLRASNIILTQLALRPGEGTTAGDSADRSAVRILPPTGGTISNIVIDHCSLSWGPDTTLSVLNNSQDITIQFCVIGPALYESNIATSPNGYASSLTTSGTSPAFYPKRITIYRCLFLIHDERGMRGESGISIEYINNASFDAGLKPASGNMQGASFMGNMIKKGPESSWAGGANNAWFAQIAGGVFTSYFPQSIYFPVTGDTLAPSHVNIGISAAGAVFVPDRSFGGSSKRSAPYGTAPTVCPLSTPSLALFAEVVNQAGRTYQDATDTTVKAHAIAGTSDGFYNAAGFSAPHPSW